MIPGARFFGAFIIVGLVYALVLAPRTLHSRLEQRILDSADIAWEFALGIGMPERQRPTVSFVDLEDEPSLWVECLPTRPVIYVNEKALARTVWVVNHGIVHEMAHVVVCIEEGRLSPPHHGLAWQHALRRLVSKPMADAIMDDQKRSEAARYVED